MPNWVPLEVNDFGTIFYTTRDGHRHPVQPGRMVETWVDADDPDKRRRTAVDYIETDLGAEPELVQAFAALVWTDEVRAAWRARVEAAQAAEDEEAAAHAAEVKRLADERESTTAAEAAAVTAKAVELLRAAGIDLAALAPALKGAATVDRNDVTADVGKEG